MSDTDELAIIVVRDGCVYEASPPARRAFPGLCFGMRIENLFVDESRAKAEELLAADVPMTAELALATERSEKVRVSMLPLPGERLRIVVLQDVAHMDDVASRLVNANSELASLTRQLSRRLHELDTERAWLQNTIDQMPDGVLLYDANGKMKAMNQAVRALRCGRARSDPYGNTCLLDARETDGAVVPFDELPMIRALRKQEPVIRKELLLCRDDDSRVPVSISAVPVWDAEGKFSGVTAVIKDISARKELERQREEWSAIVAHDLRQPVGTVALAAESLLRLHRSDWTSGERRILDRISATSRRLSRMIADLSDASQIESNRLSIDPRIVELGPLVQSIVENLDEAVGGHEVKVTVEGSPRARVDPDRMHQVIANLVVNAAKYGCAGSEILVDVCARGDVVDLAVTNRGEGIAPDQIPTLFNRFTRAREARASRAPGLGLGLYIAKGLVEAQGGTISVQSIFGETTTFHVVLPLATETITTEPRSRGHLDPTRIVEK